MDQDSKWVNFAEYVSMVQKSEKEIYNAFAYGPKVIVSSEGQFTLESSIVKVDQLITSGMLVNLKHLRAIGGYCEDLWIDGIDEELCLRAQSNQLMLYRIESEFLLQQYGSGKRIAIKKHEFIIPAYNAQRKYYIAKNHIYLIKKYKLGFREKKDIIINYIIYPIANTLLFEKDKCNKLKSITHGVIDGIKWKVK